MKLRALLLLPLGWALGVAAESTPPATSAPKAAPRIELKAPPAKAGTAAAEKAAKDAKAAKAAKDAIKKKEDEIGTIEGITIPRSENRFLGIQLVEGKFKLTFYNNKKKPVAPDVSRAVVRWDPKYKVGLERTVLTASGPHALTSDKFVRPPYNFKLTIVLLRDTPDIPPPAESATEPVGETHVIDFRQ